MDDVKQLPVLLYLWHYNNSVAENVSCAGELHRNTSCLINPTEQTKRDAITTVRMVVSCLSILGSLSIIVSVLWRKVLLKPKIHPIFMLSVADTLLGVSWILGGAFWFSRIENRSWCYLPTLLTVIMQCVSVNLTVVYAVVAYSVIKRQDFSAILSSATPPVREWQVWKTVTAYVLSWTLPVVIVCAVFGAVSELYGIVQHANSCSCWCLPYFENIVPLALNTEDETSEYIFRVRKLILSCAVFLVLTYLFGFTLLVFMYAKILSHIRHLRKSHTKKRSGPSYGAVETLLVTGHSQAKKRVICFLLAFIITGFANLLLCVIFAIFEAVLLAGEAKTSQLPSDGIPKDHMSDWFKVFLYSAQSLTAPLQGFLNALVYGWTKDDFTYRGGGGGGGGGGGKRRIRHRSFGDSVSSDDGVSNSGLAESGNYDCEREAEGERKLGGSSRLTGSSTDSQRRSWRAERNIQRHNAGVM